ncbi:MAG: hypothetical protein GXX08_08050 [Firmicutes bacterium]|nr:hypothetical protein [Bacillota bacterium]
MCTIFATRAGEAVLVGRNLDWIQRGGSIWFIPPQRLYGQMSLGLSLIEQMGIDRPYEGLNMAGLFAALGRHPFYERFGFVARPTDELGPGMVYLKR